MTERFRWEIPLSRFRCRVFPLGDHPEYQWASPEYCRTCHAGLFADWTTARHSRAATNPMLLQIYNGTDVHGNPGVAPGFKLDFPFRGGDCADCHAPTAALFNPGDTDLNDVLLLGGVDTNGVHCDFCHKVRDVPVAASLAVDMYTVSKSGGLTRDFGLRDHLQRAAVSIASNIAEGKERETAPEFIRYLYIAKGSSGELKTQLIIAQRIGYIDEEHTKNLIGRVEQIGAKLGALIRTLKRIEPGSCLYNPLVLPVSHFPPVSPAMHGAVHERVRADAPLVCSKDQIPA